MIGTPKILSVSFRLIIASSTQVSVHRLFNRIFLSSENNIKWFTSVSLYCWYSMFSNVRYFIQLAYIFKWWTIMIVNCLFSNTLINRIITLWSKVIFIQFHDTLVHLIWDFSKGASFLSMSGNLVKIYKC